MDARITRVGGFFLWTTCAALLHSGAATAQGELDGPRAPVVDEQVSQTRVTLEGYVLTSDGSPAEGAVVVSSAGGKAITDAAGRYRLEVDVPLEATSVEVTAVGSAGRNLAASTRVALSAVSPSPIVDPLALTHPPSCSPAWLPTFGDAPGTNGWVFALAVFDDGR